MDQIGEPDTGLAALSPDGSIMNYMSVREIDNPMYGEQFHTFFRTYEVNVVGW